MDSARHASTYGVPHAQGCTSDRPSASETPRAHMSIIYTVMLNKEKEVEYPNWESTGMPAHHGVPQGIPAQTGKA